MALFESSFNSSAYQVSLQLAAAVGKALLLPGLRLRQYTFSHLRVGGSDGDGEERFAECASTYESPTSRICLFTSCHAFLSAMCGFEGKKIAALYEQLLGGEVDGKLDIGRDLGWGAVSAFRESLLLSTDDSSMSVGRVEAGGGLGMGFQLYCDGSLLLTSGLGGGGGFDGRVGSSGAESDSTLGGGGGFGLQFLLNHTWHDVGGGGGCGTSANDSSIVCGTFPDASSDAASLGLFLTALPSLCAGGAVLYGGGGAGGGSGGCCDSARVGYGFSFYASSSYATSVSNIVDSGSSGSDYNALLTDIPQDDFDTSGVLLREASRGCGGGGFGNWSCVCAGAKDILRRCEGNSSSSNRCAVYSSHLNRVSWIQQAPCSSISSGSIMSEGRTGSIVSEGSSYTCYDLLGSPASPLVEAGSQLFATFATALSLLVLAQAILLWRRRDRVGKIGSRCRVLQHAHTYDSL